MAIKATVTTLYGEQREVYIRLNSIEASNHGWPSHALFRGFLSKEAFKAGSHYVWEKEIQFAPDVSQPIWQQAYASLIEAEGFEAQEA